MDWSTYGYLPFVGVCALGVLALACVWLPSLSTASRKRTRHELVLLALVLTVGLLAVYWNFYAGVWGFAYLDTGVDTVDQYVPFYLHLLEKVRTGTLSSWDFDYGLGVPITAYQSWLNDPFNLVLVPLGLLLGESRLSLVLTLVQSLKVVLCAYLFDYLLTFYCERPVSRVFGASLLAFGGYLIAFGQHYWLGSVCPLLLFVLLALELLMERWSVPRFLVAAASAALLVSWSVYTAFMALVFAAVYALLRLAVVVEPLTPRAYLMRALRLIAPVACGCLIAGVAFVPQTLYLLGESNRVTGGSTSMGERVLEAATTFVPLRWIPLLLSRLLGTSLITTGQAWASEELVPASGVLNPASCFTYEFAQMGFSVVAIVLLGQMLHWALTEADRRNRRIVLLACVLTVLYCVYELFPTALYVFSGMSYRSSFILGVPVCVGVAVGFERRVLPGKVARGPLVACGALTLAILVWSCSVSFNNRGLCILYMVALCLVIAALLLSGRGAHWGSVAVVAVITLAVMTSFADAFFVTNERTLVSADEFPRAGSGGESTIAAIDMLEAEDNELWRAELFDYKLWSVGNDGLGVGFSSVTCYNSTLDADLTEFYQKLWPEVISSSSFSTQQASFSLDEEMYALLGIRYVLSVGELDVDWLEYVRQEGSALIYRNTAATSVITVRGSVVTESEADGLEDAEARRALLETSVIVEDEVAETLETSGEDDLEYSSTLEKISDDYLAGTLETSASGVAVLPIPNTAGWEVYVDGEKVETFCADYGLIGFAVGEGVHEIEAHYVLPGSGAGRFVTVAGAVGTVAGCVIGVRGGRRRSLVKVEG